MAFWIISWTTWIVIWSLSIIFISAIDWNSEIIADQAEINLAYKGPLWTYFGNQSEDVSIFHSREYMQEQMGDFKDVDREKIFNHNYTSMTAWLKEYAAKYPNITWLYSIGESVRNRTLWVMAISRTPRIHRLGVPEVKYVANMHGNEVVGREVMLYLIALLCENYGKNWYLTKFVNSMRIHIMPSINPDGYELGNEGDRSGYAGRSNDHGVDLNRNFPARFPSHRETSGGTVLEKETIAAIRWFQNYPFVLSANFHGGPILRVSGSLVANYPYDDSTAGEDNIYSPTADDRLFVALSYSYARAHRNMWKTGRRCGLSAKGDFFLNGITNGAFWYHVAGGMQDWQYVHTNCFEITVEMGCYKFPPSNMLPQLWDEHKYSLFAYMDYVHRGIRGFVLDRNRSPVKGAVLSIKSGKNITTTDQGEFWRILLPGTYTVLVSHRKYLPRIFNVTVGKGFANFVNVTLEQKFCIEKTNSVRVRGEGALRIAAFGVDSFGKKIVQELANATCLPEDLFARILQNSTLHLFPSLPTEHSLYLKDYKWDVLLLFGQGLPKSILFSAGTNTPNRFDQKTLDDSLMVALNNETTACTNYLLNRAVSSMIDLLNMTKTFQLGVSLGCRLSEPKLKLSAVASVLQMILNVFVGAKYSTTLFNDSAGNFSPPKMIGTRDILRRIEGKNCASMKNIGSMKAIVFGDGRLPHTLVMSIEKKTLSMIYEFAADLCSESLQSGPVRELLNTSTLILIPSIPYTQLFCQDYESAMLFKPFVEQVMNAYPLIDYAILLGTGVMKVGYTDVSRSGRGKNLALNYVLHHTVIKPTGNEICDSRSDYMAVTELHDDMEHWQKAPDILLVQIACCYIEGANLYNENKASLMSTLSERAQGLSGTIKGIHDDLIQAPVTLKVGNYTFHTKVDGYYYIWLSPGIYTIDVSKKSYQSYTFSAKVVSFKQSVADIMLVKIPYTSLALFKEGNIFVPFTALCVVALILIGLYRLNVAHRKRSMKRWDDGFERLPLNDFDSSASDDDEDDDDVFGSIKSARGGHY